MRIHACSAGFNALSRASQPNSGTNMHPKMHLCRLGKWNSPKNVPTRLILELNPAAFQDARDGIADQTSSAVPSWPSCERELTTSVKATPSIAFNPEASVFALRLHGSSRNFTGRLLPVKVTPNFRVPRQPGGIATPSYKPTSPYVQLFQLRYARPYFSARDSGGVCLIAD